MTVLIFTWMFPNMEEPFYGFCTKFTAYLYEVQNNLLFWFSNITSSDKQQWKDLPKVAINCFDKLILYKTSDHFWGEFNKSYKLILSTT